MNKKNNVSIIGNLGKDPEYGQSKTKGQPYCRMSICVNNSKFNRDTGNYEQTDTLWFNVICFDNLAQNAANYLKKGTLVQVEGAFKQKENNYNDKNNNPVKKIETTIFAESISIPVQALPKLLGETPNHPNNGQYQRNRQQYGYQANTEYQNGYQKGYQNQTQWNQPQSQPQSPNNIGNMGPYQPQTQQYQQSAPQNQGYQSQQPAQNTFSQFGPVTEQKPAMQQGTLDDPFPKTGPESDEDIPF